MFRVKICGITTVADALGTFDAGADAIGLNFYRQSRRFIDLHRAEDIVNVLPKTLVKVGVFVNAPQSDVRKIAKALSLDFVQLHGDEPPEVVAELADLGVIRAFRLGVAGWSPCQQYLDRCRSLGTSPRAILIDAFREAEYGGTGHSPDWLSVARFRDLGIELPLILAGGLTPQNVADAIHTVHPNAVDTASGVESAPGKKDSGKVTAFVAEALHAFDIRMPNDE